MVSLAGTQATLVIPETIVSQSLERCCYSGQMITSSIYFRRGVLLFLPELWIEHPEFWTGVLSIKWQKMFCIDVTGAPSPSCPVSLVDLKAFSFPSGSHSTGGCFCGSIPPDTHGAVRVPQVDTGPETPRSRRRVSHHLLARHPQAGSYFTTMRGNGMSSYLAFKRTWEGIFEGGVFLN